MSPPRDEIERYLRTGEHDAMHAAWPGHGLIERAKSGDIALRSALLSAVKTRTEHTTVPAALTVLDLVAFTRSKVGPMVTGLFPASEQRLVLDMLGRSVVFLTPVTIEPVLSRERFLKTAWHLANLYLASCNAPLLSADAPAILGLSNSTTCYVSMAYFKPTGRFDDYVVHEAAHVFHNCKRVTVGLHETRRREWLLDIAYGKRETFAYACEVYSRIAELGDSAAARRRLLAEVEDGPMPSDEKVDSEEFIALLRGAVAARNGWKRILEACAPHKRTRAA